MGSEQRKQRRVKGYAKVLFTKTMTPGYIRDLSTTGCQVSFVQTVPAGFADLIELQVIGGEDPRIRAFSFSLRVRWTRSDGIYFSLGGEIEGVQDQAEAGPFGELVDYYQSFSP
jgi:hypothetical protein